MNLFCTYINNRIAVLFNQEDGFVKNLSLLSISNLFAKILSGISLGLIGRATDVAIYGAFASSLAFSRLCSVICSFGLDLWLLNQSSTCTKDEVPKINGLVILWKLLTGPIWIVLLGAISLILNQKTYPISIVIFCAILVWLEEIFRTTMFINEVNSGIKLASVFTISIQFAVALFVVFFYFVFDHTSITSYIIGYIVIYAVLCLISIYFINDRYGIRYSLKGMRIILKESVQYAISVALAVAYGKIDLTLIGNWLGRTSAGQYSPALNIAQAFSIIPNSAHGILFRRFGNAISHSTLLLKVELRKTLLLMASVGILITIFVAPFASFIIQIVYGEKFVLAGQILFVLVFIIPLRFISVTSSVLLTTVKWHQKRVYIQLVAVVFNICANLWIIFMTGFGIWGIAVVYLATEFLLAVGYMLTTQIYFLSDSRDLTQK